MFVTKILNKNYHFGMRKVLQEKQLKCNHPNPFFFTSSTKPIEPNTEDWEIKWEGVEKGDKWDASETEPFLVHLLSQNKFQNLFDKIDTPKALIPGCGRGYSVASLARAGFEAKGLDISHKAVGIANQYLEEEFFSHSNQKAKSLAKVEQADFFKLKKEEKYDLVYDCTFLCAFEPSVGPLWAKVMCDIVKPGGVLVSCIYPVLKGEADAADVPPVNGPPFNLSPRLVQGLLPKSEFKLLSMDIVPEDLRRMEIYDKPSDEYFGVWEKCV